MKLVNLKWVPEEPGEEKGCDNLFLVDVPDADFDGFLMELEDAASSYLEHVDDAEVKPAGEIAELVMENCGRHYIPVDRIGVVEI